VLEPDAALPAAPRHPAPWSMHASCYVFAVLMPEEVLDEAAFVPSELVPRRKNRISVVMFVDYTQTAVGPYRELLVAPASFAHAQGTYPSITRIFVDSYDSVVNGRLNWGIPKDRADFERVSGADGTETVRVSRDGHTFAELVLRPYGPTLPVASWLLPSPLRTLVQHWQGKSYRFTLSASGKARMASVEHWSFDPNFFPDLARGRVLTGAYLPRFEMLFPVAEQQEG
jgi:hypothetical protein